MSERAAASRAADAARPVVDLVAGARPNFIKLAPVVGALRAQGAVTARIVHTGQHYDRAMSEVFFGELGIPEPDVNLEVGSGSHGAQTARILERYEAHLLADAPRAVLVFGDVNSTIACALAAAKLGIPVVHVEAGLRSLDRTMPEELNRVLTDAISDLLLVSEPSGVEHLRREGIHGAHVRLVGNTMIDTLRRFLPLARARERARALGLRSGEFALLTLHRPSNVDDPAVLARLVDLLQRLAERLPIVFPVHPRTRAALGRLGVEAARGGLRLLEPESYLDNLSLMADARVCLTDSGGMQEETACLGVPCVTMRSNTERPVTVEVGASRLVGNDPARIRSAFLDAVEGRWGRIGEVPLWDGRAGERCAEAVAELVGAEVAAPRASS
jgi:UDP-N-acetylglucosamine 2-epimerase (non-hydrolysing)